MTLSFTSLDETGEPLFHYQVPDRAHFEQNLPKGAAHVLGQLPANSYYKNGAWVKKPDQPSDSHQWDKNTKQWVLNIELAWQYGRSQRDLLLKGTDWLVTKAVELGEPMPAGWAEYRQALRDITQQSDPNAIIWPVEPS